MNKNYYSEYFDNKYKKGGWKWRKDISPSDFGSGAGSSLRETEDFREFLAGFIRENQIKNCLDVGCGDFTYMKEIYKMFDNYTGIDVSELIINRNKELYQTDNHKFEQLNLIYDDMDVSCFDLVIIKDCLQHLGNQEVLKVLNKVDEIPFHIIVNEKIKKIKKGNLLRIESGIISQGSGLDPSLEPFNKKYDYHFTLKNNKMVFVKKGE